MYVFSHSFPLLPVLKVCLGGQVRAFEKAQAVCLLQAGGQQSVSEKPLDIGVLLIRSCTLVLFTQMSQMRASDMTKVLFVSWNSHLSHHKRSRRMICQYSLCRL